MNLPPFEYDAPNELVGALNAVADGAVPYCGGTELLASMSMGLVKPGRIVSLRKLEELRYLNVGAGALSLGATMTHREVARNDQVRATAPLLADVAQRVGNSRVRATGTVGGNLAFAEPRSDLSTVLVALGARVVLVDVVGSRLLPLAEFLQGPYETDLRSGELLVRVEVPADAAGVAIYRKVTLTERPVVGVALIRLREAAVWRVVVGAVGSGPFVVEADSLDDIDPTSVAGEVDVMADLSGAEGYKRKLTEVTIQRCCDAAREDSQEVSV
jgi:carbon-monoxide dehydrogenase medium subunit